MEKEEKTINMTNRELIARAFMTAEPLRIYKKKENKIKEPMPIGVNFSCLIERKDFIHLKEGETFANKVFKIYKASDRTFTLYYKHKKFWYFLTVDIHPSNILDAMRGFIVGVGAVYSDLVRWEE